MKRKISCDMGQRMQLETTTSLKRIEKHRDTKTQRHKGTHHASYCAPLCLCVFVSLCFCREVTPPEAPSEQTAIPHRSTEPHSRSPRVRIATAPVPGGIYNCSLSRSFRLY